MGPGAIVTPPSFEHETHRRLVRSYAFETIPPIVRNTFAAGFVLTVDRPALYFSSLGGAIESNKMIEYALERAINDVQFEGPDSADPESHVQRISGQWWGSAQTPANVSATAYIGLSMNSFGTTTPWSATPTDAVVHLRQSLKTPTSWELFSANGDGTAGELVSFSVDATPPGEGHRVVLIADPYAKTITAIVDGAVRAQITDPTKYPVLNGTGGNTRVGLFATSGVQTGPSAIFASFTGFQVTGYDTWTPGAVL